jgi:sugar (pentulose or hexulose) kinase
MEYGDASGTALLDVRTRTWSEALCNAIDPKVLSCLPPLQSSGQKAGTLRPELAQRWGLGADVVVSAGGGDNMMGAIGTGNVKAGCITASLGTSGTIYAYANQPVIDPEGEIAAFCDSTNAWLPLLCTMNVTVATEQVRHLFGWTHEQLTEAIAQTPSGSDGLLFLPYLQGERTPNLPQATGVLHGLTTKNYTPGHLARATMEGVTLGLAYGLKRLEELGVKATQIRLTGGGSKSAVWRQMCADVFGCEIVTLQNAEGAAMGGAIQALAIVDPSKTLEEWTRVLLYTNASETVRPDPVRQALYAKLQVRHTQLMRDLAAAGQL